MTNYNSAMLRSALVIVSLLIPVPQVNAAPGANKGRHVQSQSKYSVKSGNVKRGTVKVRGPAMRRLAQELNLTRAQQERIEPILQSTAKQVRALRSDKSLSQQQKRDRLRQIQAAAVNRINTVLNAQQRKKFALLLQQLRKSRPSLQP